MVFVCHSRHESVKISKNERIRSKLLIYLLQGKGKMSSLKVCRDTNEKEVYIRGEKKKNTRLHWRDNIY